MEDKSWFFHPYYTKVCFDAQCSVGMEETLLDFKGVMRCQVISPSCHLNKLNLLSLGDGPGLEDFLHYHMILWLD